MFSPEIDTAEFNSQLRSRILFLLESSTPAADLIAMRLTAKPVGSDIQARVDFTILYAIACHIGTNDPLSEANLQGMCAERHEFERVLNELICTG